MIKLLFKSGDIFLSLRFSLLYRLTIILYSIFLYQINDSSVLNIGYFIAIIVTYIFVYLLLLVKNKHFLRTVIDYIYMILILLGSDIFIYHNFVLLLFPFVNLPNHTGNTRRPFVVFALASTSFLVLYIFQNNYEIQLRTYIEAILVIFFFLIVSFFDVSKNKNLEYIFDIYNKIDAFTITEPSRTQVPKIYRMLIKEIKEKLGIYIDKILCFRIDENDIKLINSSSFILTYDFNTDNMHAFGFSEFDIKLNDKNEKVILSFKEKEYYFFIIQSKDTKKMSLYGMVMLHSIANYIFQKISTIIIFEAGLKLERYNRLKNIHNQQHYVLESMQSTHYLTNKLSPIKNYITSQIDLGNSKMSKDIKVKMQHLANDELKQANKSLRDINTKTMSLLNKKENPFIATNHEEIMAKRIYMIIKDMWSYEFLDSQVSIDMNSVSRASLEKKYNIDIGTLELILVDIVVNIKKYSKDFKKVLFKFSDTLSINFINDFEDSDSMYTHLKKIEDNYNNDNRIEINRSQKFGLLHIKEQAKQNGIKTVLEVNKEYFIMKLVFERY